MQNFITYNLKEKAQLHYLLSEGKIVIMIAFSGECNCTFVGHFDECKNKKLLILCV